MLLKVVLQKKQTKTKNFYEKVEQTFLLIDKQNSNCLQETWLTEKNMKNYAICLKIILMEKNETFRIKVTNAVTNCF